MSSLLDHALVKQSSSAVKMLWVKLINKEDFAKHLIFKEQIEKNRLDAVKELFNLYPINLTEYPLIFHATSVEMLQFLESKGANFWQISPNGRDFTSWPS